MERPAIEGANSSKTINWSKYKPQINMGHTNVYIAIVIM